jgi:hypothetical protein
MNVLVCGEAPVSNGFKVFDTLDRIAARLGIHRVLYGDGGGAGRLACAWADRRNVRLKNVGCGAAEPLFPRKRQAGADRPDLVVAFVGGRRTNELVRRAKEVGLVVIEVDAEQPPPPGAAKRLDRSVQPAATG